MPRAFDTSPRVAAVHAQLYRDVGPAKRAEIMAELSDGLRDLAAAGVRQRHPEYDDERVLEEVLAVFYGRVPRATQDIDVVIEPTREQLVALMNKFTEPTYDADRDDALDAFNRKSMFSVIDRRGIWKIDFILRKPRPFSKKEFDRRLRIDILDVSVYAATPENVLLAKLAWAKLGESERQSACCRDHRNSGRET